VRLRRTRSSSFRVLLVARSSGVNDGRKGPALLEPFWQVHYEAKTSRTLKVERSKEVVASPVLFPSYSDEIVTNK
jgi:hypothetical protein